MDTSSNQLSFFTLTGLYKATKLASGLTINTDSVIAAGDTHGSCITDILIRNLDGSNIRNFDVIICATGSNATVEHRICQVAIPVNAGNNGTIPLASLAALAPQIFDLDLSGNRIINLESGQSIYLRNVAALTADVYVNVKQRAF
jgi:hypothetical protein